MFQSDMVRFLVICVCCVIWNDMDLSAFLAFSISLTRGRINSYGPKLYVLDAGWPNFLYFTTVIVINFEADYLLNRWTYRNTGVGLINNF
jgi:hypothetical protein